MSKYPRFLSATAALALCGLCAAPLISGCRTQAPPMTEAEKSNFQGGPMPDDVRQKMEEHNRKMQQGGAQPGGGAPQAPPPGPPQ
jgi:hypothetical protein